MFLPVMLQPFQYDPTEKNKHKFLVQSMSILDGISDNQDLLVCLMIIIITMFYDNYRVLYFDHPTTACSTEHMFQSYTKMHEK